jgi:HNH endonuclease
VKWRGWEHRLLRVCYRKLGPERLGEILGRSACAVKSRAGILGLRLPDRRAWTEAEMAVVRKLYPHRPTAEVARKVGHSMSGTYQLARRLDLLKTAEYLASPAACRLRRGDNVGWAYRFPKGNVPYNKGLRRPGYAPGRMAETMFKPGVRQGMAAKNWKPIGTIRGDHEGYLRIKVREGKKGEAYGFGNTRIWPLLNRHVWEQHHGAIPEGHIVVFKDRNRSNCELENLELITLAENMRRNTIHNYPPELKEAIRAAASLRRRIRKREQAQGVNTPPEGGTVAAELVA